MNADSLQTDAPEAIMPVILNYHDPSIRRRLARSRLARCFAAALAVSAFAIAASAIAQGWVGNRLLEFGVWLLIAVGLLLLLRAVNLCKAVFRWGWISAVAVFGLWCAVMISNQTHGHPPPTDWYFIAGFGLSCVLSAFALVFDPTGRVPES